MFYEVICYADSSFSHKLKDEFFRDGVLKHSIERSQPKKIREKKIKMKSSVSLNTDTNNIHNNNNGVATENTGKAAEPLTPFVAECNVKSINDNNSECEDNDGYSSSSLESIADRVAQEYFHDQADQKLATQ